MGLIRKQKQDTVITISNGTEDIVVHFNNISGNGASATIKVMIEAPDNFHIVHGDMNKKVKETAPARVLG